MRFNTGYKIFFGLAGIAVFFYFRTSMPVVAFAGGILGVLSLIGGVR